MSLQAIKYDEINKTLEILNQLILPHQSVYVPIKDTQQGFKAIKDMVVRGAPAIAIVAALSLAVEVYHSDQIYSAQQSKSDASEYITSKLKYIVQARPTAVNLSKATKSLQALVDSTLDDPSVQNGQDVCNLVIRAAEDMLTDDVNDNTSIGNYGAEWIQQQLNNQDNSRFSVLTICNTGSLATAGYGTALGIIRSIHANGSLIQAYALETRPYNQGSRLTAYELVHDGIPATLITDSMASALLRSHPEIKLVVVGADRVAGNGDTANKIGTYQLAVTAKHHNVKFVVAAPTTSIDLNTANGDSIVIEERAPNELVQVSGPEVVEGVIRPESVKTVSIAAPGINVWNPAFDVTPNELIDAIVTENGVAEKVNGEFDLKSLFK